MSTLGVVFAGGGTGGHLFPALAIAEQLGPGVQTHYLCSSRPMDAKVLDAAGVQYTPLRAQPPRLRPRKLLGFVASWGPSVRTTRRVIREMRSHADRVHMVTMGGFVAPPAVQAARAEKIPVLMVNLDAVPGLANRFIATRVNEIVTAVRVEGRDWQAVPPVVRRELRDARDPGSCRASLGLDPNRKTLLITGGSQGALSVGQFALGVAQRHTDFFRDWQVIHQAGTHMPSPSGREGFAAQWADLGIRAHTVEFLSDMPSAWWAADLHLGRCGAGTVAEAWATRTPSVFMPYPWHKDQHQKFNASALTGAGAAVLIDDRIDASENVSTNAEVLAGLLAEPSLRAAMVEALRSLGEPNGAEQIAARVLSVPQPG